METNTIQFDRSNVISVADLIPRSVPIGMHSSINMTTAAGITIKTGINDSGFTFGISRQLDTEKSPGISIFGEENYDNEKDLVKEVVLQKIEKDRQCTLEDQKKIETEVQKIFKQKDAYLPLYQLWAEPNTFKTSPLGFFAENRQKEQVGNILAIPKNSNGSVIVEMPIGDEMVTMSKRSGQDIWEQLDPQRPTPAGLQATKDLFENKEGVVSSVNDYIDRINDVKPYQVKIKNVVAGIEEQRQSQENTISRGR